VPEEKLGMSVVMALSLVLFVGFVATGLVGFLVWRQRMCEGETYHCPSPSEAFTNQHANWLSKHESHDLEGARL
jgi:hypothetical protein